jgi:hypothetical protein
MDQTIQTIAVLAPAKPPLETSPIWHIVTGNETELTTYRYSPCSGTLTKQNEW